MKKIFVFFILSLLIACSQTTKQQEQKPAPVKNLTERNPYDSIEPEDLSE